jgi:hypothetical protein
MHLLPYSLQLPETAPTVLNNRRKRALSSITKAASPRPTVAPNDGIPQKLLDNHKTLFFLHRLSAITAVLLIASMTPVLQQFSERTVITPILGDVC